MTEAEVEEAEREKSAPVPLRLTAWLAPALSVTLSVPLRLPAVEGVMVTLIAQVAPAATALPQLLVSANCPEAATPPMLTLALPVLVTVTICDALTWPTLTLPKLRLVGDTLTVVDPEDETPDPVRGIV